MKFHFTCKTLVGLKFCYQGQNLHMCAKSWGDDVVDHYKHLDMWFTTYFVQVQFFIALCMFIWVSTCMAAVGFRLYRNMYFEKSFKVPVVSLAKIHGSIGNRENLRFDHFRGHNCKNQNEGLDTEGHAFEVVHLKFNNFRYTLLMTSWQ